MRLLHSVMIGIFLSGLSIASANAGQEACPGEQVIKPQSCPPDSWEGCEYKITSASGANWVGSDPLEYGKNDQIQLKFIAAQSRKVADGTSQVFCDYEFRNPDGSDTKDGLRLSLEKPVLITLSSKWSVDAANNLSSCQNQDSSSCTFIVGAP